MSSILSTQKRQTFLRRKYCFFCAATALSPPVGLCPALPGLPLDSAIFASPGLFRRPFHHHLLRHRRLCRRGRGRRRGSAMRPFVAVLLSFVQALQRLIDTNRKELDHQVRDAQATLEFLHGLRRGAELKQHVKAFPVLVDPVSQLALAPFFGFFHGAARRGDHRFHLLDELIHLLVGRIRLHDKQLFVDPHASSAFEPGARRLKIVMDFSTPSAIMEATASAPRATSSSTCSFRERLIGASRYSAPSLSL